MLKFLCLSVLPSLSLHFPIPENELFLFLGIYGIIPLYCSYKSDNHQLFNGYEMWVNYTPPCVITVAVICSISGVPTS